MAQDFVINVESVSDIAIRSDLVAFVASRPDNEKWAQFFQASSGQLTVEMVVALATWLKYDSVSSRRENYLPYALTRAGNLAGGQQLGYGSYRGKNAIIELTYTPSTNGTLPQWHILGDVKGSPLVLLNETIVNAGTPITVTATVGDILEQEIQSNTGNASTFRFTEKNVSEDVRIYVNAVLVDQSNDVLDMLKDKFFLQTNAIGSVDAKSLNQASTTTPYSNGSIIKLEWVELKDLTFVTSDIAIDETEGVLTAVEVTNLFDAQETNASIKVNAPLANETKYTIRGRNDYSKLLLLADPDFVAAGGRDTAVAAVIEIFALRDDLSVPDAAEKQALLDSISSNRPLGILPPIIIDAAPNFMPVAVSLTLDETIGDTDALVRGILATYEKKLSTPEEIQSVDFVEIEKQMTESDLVKISRIVIGSTTWALNTSYRRGLHIVPTTDNGFIYEALEFNRYSGSVEPTWPIPIPAVPPSTDPTYGQTVIDNSIVWVTIAEDNTLNDWTADSVYKAGDKVKHLSTGGNSPDASFQAQEVLHKSNTSFGATFANVLEQGATYTADVIGADGNLITMVFDGVADVDAVTTAWNLGNPANTVSFSGVVGSFVPTANTTTLIGGVDAIDGEPVWDEPADIDVPDTRSFEEDNQILWLMVNKVGTPTAWSSNTVYAIGDTVVPNTPSAGQVNMMWQAVSATGKTDGVEPTFPTAFGSTIIDNEVTWIARSPTASPESPADNEYYLITETISVA